MRVLYKVKPALVFIFVLAMACPGKPAEAQGNAHFEPWITFTTQQYLKKVRFWFRNDVSIRPAFDDDFNTTYLVRPRAIFDAGSLLDLHAAVDFRYTRYTELENTFEIRTWEGVALHWPDIGRVKFDHFYRFEQRFHMTKGFERDHRALRSRYRFNMRIPLNNTSTTDHTYFTNVRAEAFIPHGENIEESWASTFRLGLAFGYNKDNKWRYQLIGYVDRGRDAIEDSAQANRYILEAKVQLSF